MIPYKELKTMVKLANRLDLLGLHGEADVLDLIVKESGFLDNLSKGIKGRAFGLGLGLSTLMPAGIGLDPSFPKTIVQKEVKTTLGPEDFKIIKVKSGDNLGKIARREFPDIDVTTGTNIILEFNDIKRGDVLKRDMEIKIPKIEALREIGYEERIGVGLSREGCINSPSDSLRQFLMNIEGEELNIYDTGVGNQDLTIGYGHSLTQKERSELNSNGKTVIHGVTVRAGQPISKQDAKRIFNGDLDNAVKTVNRANLSNINQSQYDALVSLVFNIGSIPGEIKNSILAGSLDDVPNQMRDYVNADGEASKGLANRREREINLWLGT